MLIFDNVTTRMIFAGKLLFDTHTLFEQCTYLGYFLLEAPRKYVQHGPLLSINWLRLCPHSGACVRSHAARRRLFIVLMTAAHISPNVFSLQNFLSNVHVLFLLYIQLHSNLLYITFRQSIKSFYLHDNQLFYFSGSSWQASCPLSLVSITLCIVCCF
jgi:hypothetical protein